MFNGVAMLTIPFIKMCKVDPSRVYVTLATTAPAPFSYLTLFCPIVNEISGPKRVTHHIFYSVQKIADVQRKKES